MTSAPWQLQSPIDAIIFDCDGTLSTIEGIDELAKENGAGDAVKAITAKAMGETGVNPIIYEQRLKLVSPTKNQVAQLSHQYYAHRIPDALSVIQVLKRLHKEIYLISAGLYPAVHEFGVMLEIPRQNIFAVDIQFDQHGHFKDYDRSSTLTNYDGKRKFVMNLNAMHQSIGYIGDGLNDFEVYDLVTRFIGFGGAYYRENIASRCHYYINTPAFAPMLPLMLTEEEYRALLPTELALYQHGIQAMEESKVKY